jgi:hypothetical protein
MPRRKATATNADESVTMEPLAGVAHESPLSAEAPEPLMTPTIAEHSRDSAADKQSAIPDPRSLMSVNLGPSNDSPKMHLLRSYRFRQMQIRSDEPLSEHHQAILKEAGWTDRTDQEGLWTKQIPKDSGWQPAADAERVFKQIANEIRADKGLGKVLEMDR